MNNNSTSSDNFTNKSLNDHSTSSDIIYSNVHKQTSNPILDEYKRKYKPEELTDDGIPTIETQLKELKEKDEEYEKRMEEEKDKRYKRDMIQRVKCISLDRMGLDIFTNTSNMSTRDRIKLQDIMWSFNDIDHSKIIEEFNSIAGAILDDTHRIDYSKIPIYDA